MSWNAYDLFIYFLILQINRSACIPQIYIYICIKDHMTTLCINCISTIPNWCTFACSWYKYTYKFYNSWAVQTNLQPVADINVKFGTNENSIHLEAQCWSASKRPTDIPSINKIYWFFLCAYVGEFWDGEYAIFVPRCNIIFLLELVFSFSFFFLTLKIKKLHARI